MRTIYVDTAFSATINNLKQSSAGLILGQSLNGKEYALNFVRTAPIISTAKIATKSLSDLPDNFFGEHAKQVTKMLPGGIVVLGIYLATDEDILTPFQSKVKTVLSQLYKQLSAEKYLFGSASHEQIALHLHVTTKQMSTKSYDVNTGSVKPVEFKFIDNIKWIQLECKYDLNELYHLNENVNDNELKQHINKLLNGVSANLNQSLFLFDGELKEDDDVLESLGRKKKIQKGSKHEPEKTKDLKTVVVTILKNCNTTEEVTMTINKIDNQMKLVGTLMSTIWLHPKVTFSDCSVAISQDILRSLATRLEMHWDSLIEEEQKEDVNTIHEPPRRVLMPFPKTPIYISDYLFPGEGSEEIKASVEDVFGISIQNVKQIQDLEGHAEDYSNYLCSSVITEVKQFHKDTTDYVKFMYIVGTGFAVLVLIISLIVHIFKF